MARKTFIPTLIYMLHRVCRYIVRYRDTIITHLPEGGAALLDAVYVACLAFTDAVEHTPTE